MSVLKLKVIVKLTETRTYLDKVVRTLVLILPKIRGYVKTFKDKNNKLMSLRMDDEKLSEKYKTIWTKVEGLKILY